VVDHDGIQIYFVGHLDGALVEPLSVIISLSSVSLRLMWMISLGADHPSRSDQPTVPRLFTVGHGSSKHWLLRSGEHHEDRSASSHRWEIRKNEQSSILKLVPGPCDLQGASKTSGFYTKQMKTLLLNTGLSRGVICDDHCHRRDVRRTNDSLTATVHELL
jgi:hypothetical protein